MIRQATAAVSLLFAVPHELTHYAVARLGTDDAQMRVEVIGGTAITRWRGIDSRALEAAAFLAPTLFGSLLLLLWAIADISIDGWRLVMLIGLVAYSIPSPADIRGAIGHQRQDNQQ